MRLVTFDRGQGPRVGAVVRDTVIDFARLPGSLPTDMLELIRAGHETWQRAQEAVAGASALLASLASEDAAPLANVKLLAPIPRPTKNVFCLGVNYKAHLAESNLAHNRDLQPQLPVYFTKAVTSIVAPDGPVRFDESVSVKMDWEAELGLVIGSGGRGISRENALGHVFGYTCFNDVTARDVQSAHVQWFLGKSHDGTCPFGPWIVTADEIPDPGNLKIECRVNGVVKQSSNTGLMINDIPAIIFYLSRALTLEPGDLISTGTPEGVGFARKPPEFLKPGDVVEVEVEKVGILRNPVVDAREID